MQLHQHHLQNVGTSGRALGKDPGVFSLDPPGAQAPVRFFFGELKWDVK